MTSQKEPASPYPKHTSSLNHGTMPPYSEDDYGKVDLSFSSIRIKLGLALAFVGYLIFLLGARPSLFGLDRSPVVGFVQISVFLVGLAIISVGSYLTLDALWPEGQKSIAAQIGPRLISTGYVICIFTGMADVFGLGSHPLPDVFFGPLQARGMGLGMMTIAAGFLLMIRYTRPRNHQNSKQNSATAQNQEDTSQTSEGVRNVNISILSLFQ